MKRVALSEIKPGETVVIERFALPASEEQFLTRFGLFVGAEVRCARRAPLGDPTVYMLEESEIALRAETASRIFAARARTEIGSEQF